MQNKQAQKIGFRVLFLIEMWERFGFYTVCSLLVLYMTKALGFADSTAYTTFATFSALLYITPIIGGYLADQHIGYRRSLFIGVISLLCGYVCLSFHNTQALYLGLALVIIGCGFFKSMPYAMLGKLYEDQPEQLNGKFTLYYLAINIGGIPALIFAGTIAHYIGWNAAFAVSAFGLVIALLVFAYGKKYLTPAGNHIDHQYVASSLMIGIFMGVLLGAWFCSYLLTHAQIANLTIYVIAVVALIYLAFKMRKLTKLERKQLVACLAMFVVGTAFFVFYYQAPTSLTLFVDRHVDHHVLGVYLPSSSYWGFNPVWIIILGPILSRLYQALGKYDPSIAMKFGFGIILMGIGYYFLMLGMHFANSAGIISSWWVIGSYGFQAAAELFVSALGNGLASRYAPKHLVGVMIGLWFLATSIGGIIAGKLANIAAVNPHIENSIATLQIYKHAFFTYGNIALIVGLIGCVCAPFIMSLSKDRLTSPGI